MKSNKTSSVNNEYDPECCLVKTVFNSVGYHSQVKSGTIVHPIRNSIEYAFSLLNKNDKSLESRAHDVIRKIISLQDTDLYSPTYGIWSWLYEEPVDKMAPPDFNWADFIGAVLCEIIITHPEKLPDSLKEDIRNSIIHASYSIFRRNVQPGYTNIALMGAAVTAIGGELSDDKRLCKYARLRIIAFYNHMIEVGFNEYNSPTYTKVAISEMDRILRLSKDPVMHEYAEKIRVNLWQMVADHYHPATKQLVGPYSRAYSDLLRAECSDFIEQAVSEEYAEDFDLATCAHNAPIPCPEYIRKRFKKLPEDEVNAQHNYIHKPVEYVGTTWMTKDACLGSINHECMWVQRRTVFGYWTIPNSAPAIFKISALKDGKEFASMGIWNTQNANRILSGIKTYNDMGDYHLYLDKNEDGCFEFESLVVRCELIAENAKLERISSNQLALIAGDYKAVITHCPGTFKVYDIDWKEGAKDDSVYLDAVLYYGDKKSFKFDNNLHTNLVFSTEILKVEQLENEEIPTIQNTNQSDTVVSWKDLKLRYNQYGIDSKYELY